MASKWGVLAAVFVVAVIIQGLLPYLGQIITFGALALAAAVIVPMYFRFLKAMIKVYALILLFMIALHLGRY